MDFIIFELPLTDERSGSIRTAHFAAIDVSRMARNGSTGCRWLLRRSSSTVRCQLSLDVRWVSPNERGSNAVRFVYRSGTTVEA